MNGAQLLIIGVAIALAFLAVYALRRGRRQREKEIQSLRHWFKAVRAIREEERADPEFVTLDGISWWEDINIWSHEPEDE